MVNLIWVQLELSKHSRTNSTTQHADACKDGGNWRPEVRPKANNLSLKISSRMQGEYESRNPPWRFKFRCQYESRPDCSRICASRTEVREHWKLFVICWMITSRQSWNFPSRIRRIWTTKEAQAIEVQCLRGTIPKSNWKSN